MHCFKLFKKFRKDKETRPPIADNHEAGKQFSKKKKYCLVYTSFVLAFIIRAKSNIFINQWNLTKMRKTRNRIQSTNYIVPFLISMILWFDPRHSYIKDRSNYLQLSGISVKKVAKKYYHNILMIMFTEFIQIYSLKDFIYPSIKVLHSLMLEMLRNNFSSCHECGEWLMNTKTVLLCKLQNNNSIDHFIDEVLFTR